MGFDLLYKLYDRFFSDLAVEFSVIVSVFGLFSSVLSGKESFWNDL